MIMNNDKELFKDINIRLGFQYSMNVDKVINQVLRGDYERLQAITRGYGKYTNKTLRARKFDLAKAKEYFAKAGWTKKKMVKVSSLKVIKHLPQQLHMAQLA